MHPATTTPAGSAAQNVTRHPSGYRARAWWGDQLLADSTAAVRVEEPGQAPGLYFPRGDVRVDLLRDEDRTTTCPVKGRARLWTVPGEATPAAATSWSAADSLPATVDGVDAVWSFTEPAAGVGWLTDLVAFDHDRVRVEIVDGRDGDDPRDVTVKRFPTWGDASHLIDIMDVRRESDRRYVSVVRTDHMRPVVEGSQMLGQAIVAAGRHAYGRRTVSAHMVFFRPADANKPLEFDLDELTGGRTFTTLGVRVSQDARPRAAGTLLCDVTAPDVMRHVAPPPPCAGPYDSPHYDMSVTGRDIRMVDDAYTDDPNAPVGPPVIDSWVRFRDVPDDPYLHAGLLAQYTGHISIAAAMRPHAGIGQTQAHRTLSTGINAIAISLHADVRADRWMRYHHLSTFAGDGMTHSECRVYTEDDRLLASFTVDAMVRAMPNLGQPVDDRTAI